MAHNSSDIFVNHDGTTSVQPNFAILTRKIFLPLNQLIPKHFPRAIQKHFVLNVHLLKVHALKSM